MDELTDRLKQMPMPSRSDCAPAVGYADLEGLFEAHARNLCNLDRTASLSGFRKLRELATSRAINDGLCVSIYEASLEHSLRMDDMDGFCIASTRLVNELYQGVDTFRRPGVTALLLLFYALDASRDGDFASTFYRLPDAIRRTPKVQFALSSYMALKRCDYAGWECLIAEADEGQLCLIKVSTVRLMAASG